MTFNKDGKVFRINSRSEISNVRRFTQPPDDGAPVPGRTWGPFWGLEALLLLGFSGFSGRGAFCFVGNGSVLLRILAGVREWHLRRVLTIVRVGVAKIPHFQLCAKYQDKTFTNNMLNYQTTWKSIALYDQSDLNM